jgi:hypothetical protein
MSPWRIAAWSVAAFLLLLPLVAMQFTDEVDWTASDFVFAAILLFGTLGLYEVAARRAGSATYRAAVIVALAGAFLLVWSNAAVGITDTEADVLYLGVIAVGLLGAVAARFRPRGMAIAMGATALALATLGVGAQLTGMVAPHNTAIQMLGIHGFFGALFAASALLFWQAAPTTASPEANR